MADDQQADPSRLAPRGRGAARQLPPGRGAGRRARPRARCWCAHHFLSLDPVHARPHERRQELRPAAAARRGDEGGTVGEVVDSKHPSYKPGDKVVGMGGWQQYSLVDAGDAGRAAQGRHQPDAALGLPRRGRHAGRHGLVRPDEDLRAEGRARRSSSAPPAARSAASSASSRRRAAAARSASPAAPTSAATSPTSSASTPASTTRRTPIRSRSTRR